MHDWTDPPCRFRLIALKQRKKHKERLPSTWLAAFEQDVGSGQWRFFESSDRELGVKCLTVRMPTFFMLLRTYCHSTDSVPSFIMVFHNPSSGAIVLPHADGSSASIGYLLLNMVSADVDAGLPTLASITLQLTVDDTLHS